MPVSNKKYSIILWRISRQLTELIMKSYKINFKQAVKLLFTSKTYAMLEDESNKLWHFSALFLFKVLDNEQKTGLFEMPEVIL
ncbi:MAG: hypothetical protein LBL00_04095 [Endomicrobium sp.]|jgi:hypothetical protein|nr:hypothetical protein [Endomicrobium sp.]